MKTHTITRLFAFMLPTLTLVSCKTEDPSALRESQKTLADTLAA